MSAIARILSAVSLPLLRTVALPVEDLTQDSFVHVEPMALAQVGADEQSLLIEKTDSSDLGYEGGASVWAVPLPYGYLHKSDYQTACGDAGLKPVCEGDHSCDAADQHCVVLEIEAGYCGHPMRGVANALGHPDATWPFFRGMCNYENTDGWESGACSGPFMGRLRGNSVFGIRYAMCAGPSEVKTASGADNGSKDSTIAKLQHKAKTEKTELRNEEAENEQLRNELQRDTNATLASDEEKQLNKLEQDTETVERQDKKLKNEVKGLVHEHEGTQGKQGTSDASLRGRLRFYKHALADDSEWLGVTSVGLCVVVLILVGTAYVGAKRRRSGQSSETSDSERDCVIVDPVGAPAWSVESHRSQKSQSSQRLLSEPLLADAQWTPVEKPPVAPCDSLSSSKSSEASASETQCVSRGKPPRPPNGVSDPSTIHDRNAASSGAGAVPPNSGVSASSTQYFHLSNDGIRPHGSSESEGSVAEDEENCSSMHSSFQEISPEHSAEAAHVVVTLQMDSEAAFLEASAPDTNLSPGGASKQSDGSTSSEEWNVLEGSTDL